MTKDDNYLCRARNNTDLSTWVYYTSAAPRDVHHVLPRPGAGNKYAARVEYICPTCGKWCEYTHDPRGPATCACAEEEE